jgi:hypothetical protein
MRIEAENDTARILHQVPVLLLARPQGFLHPAVLGLEPSEIRILALQSLDLGLELADSFGMRMILAGCSADGFADHFFLGGIA